MEADRSARPVSTQCHQTWQRRTAVTTVLSRRRDTTQTVVGSSAENRRSRRRPPTLRTSQRCSAEQQRHWSWLQAHCRATRQVPGRLVPRRGCVSVQTRSWRSPQRRETTTACLRRAPLPATLAQPKTRSTLCRSLHWSGSPGVSRPDQMPRQRRATPARDAAHEFVELGSR